MQIEANEAKEKLYEMLCKLGYGEEDKYTITMNGQPVATLQDYHATPRKRKMGVADGQFIVPSLEEWKSRGNEIAEMFGVM